MTELRKVWIADETSGTTADVENLTDGHDIHALNALLAAAAMYMRINSDTVKMARMDPSTHTAQMIDYAHHEVHANSHYFVEDYTTLNDTDTLDICFTTDDGTAVPHILFAFSGNGLLTLDIYEGCVLVANTGTQIVQRGNQRNKCYIGSHTAVASSTTVMTDSAASFTVDALIGWKIYNVTDGSWGEITDNDATTVTVTSLQGGTDNDWDTNDQYEINRSLSILREDQTVTTLGQKIGGQSGGDASNPNRGIPGGNSRDDEIPLRMNTSYVFRFTSGANSNIISYKFEWYEHTDKD